MTQASRIFVTVGSTDFDLLVRAVDTLAPSLPGTGIMQIGHGAYEPQNWPHFRFAPTLAPYYDQATLVIAHGGLATTMEVLNRGLPLVGVSNHDRPDHHQDDLLAAMEKEGHLIWCRDLDNLDQAIHSALTVPRKPYHLDECQIHLRIHEFLAS